MVLNGIPRGGRRPSALTGRAKGKEPAEELRTGARGLQENPVWHRENQRSQNVPRKRERDHPCQILLNEDEFCELDAAEEFHSVEVADVCGKEWVKWMVGET